MKTEPAPFHVKQLNVRVQFEDGRWIEHSFNSADFPKLLLGDAVVFSMVFRDASGQTLWLEAGRPDGPVELVLPEVVSRRRRAL